MRNMWNVWKSHKIFKVTGPEVNHSRTVESWTGVNEEMLENNSEGEDDELENDNEVEEGESEDDSEADDDEQNESGDNIVPDSYTHIKKLITHNIMANVETPNFDQKLMTGCQRSRRCSSSTRPGKTPALAMLRPTGIRWSRWSMPHTHG
jgi:hypothetical protein